MILCVLHLLADKSIPFGDAAGTVYWPEASATLFGLSLCGTCLEFHAPLLAEGASVREIIAKALAGEVAGVRAG